MSTRWCTTRARSASVGLAVPMSIPRYTMAESTLTIWAGKRSPSSNDSRVLPAPVGPIRSTTGRTAGLTRSLAGVIASAPAQEQPVQLVQGDARPGRAAVVALVGVIGALHLAQERVHLRHRHGAVGTHGGAAGERRHHLVRAGTHALAAAVLRQIGEHIA